MVVAIAIGSEQAIRIQSIEVRDDLPTCVLVGCALQVAMVMSIHSGIWPEEQECQESSNVQHGESPSKGVPLLLLTTTGVILLHDYTMGIR